MKTINLLQQTTILGIIGSTVLLAPLSSEALTVEEVTNPQTTNSGWVTDMADVLSDDAEAELNRLITNLEQTNGAEIAVVTVPETAPSDSPKTFATQLFNHWGIGKAEADNGILFLISTADRRVEIETGYGMEGILPDAKVSNIIDTKITPQYKQGNYDRGTIDGTKALIGSLDSSLAETVSIPILEEQTNENRIILAILAGIGVAAVGLFVSLFVSSRNKSRRVLINPSKAVTHLDRQDSRNICCAECKQPMKKVGNLELTEVQQVARKIGSVSYRGYKCSDCSSSNSLQPYTLLAYASYSSRYQECPKCQELTVTRTEEILRQPSYTNKGERIVKDTCQCCEYVRETTESLPRRRRRNHTNRGSSSSSSSSYYGGGYSGGSSSGGSSSGGGFGGGSSGGGGAGGSW